MKSIITVILVINLQISSLSQGFWQRLETPLEVFQTLDGDTSYQNLKSIILDKEANLINLKYTYSVMLFTERYGNEEKAFLLDNILTIQDTVKLNRNDLEYYLWYFAFKVDMITRGVLGDTQAIEGMKYLRDNPENPESINLNAISYLAEAGIFEDYQTVISLTNHSDIDLRNNAICLLSHFIKNTAFTEEIKSIFIPIIKNNGNADYNRLVSCCIDGLAEVDTTSLNEALEWGFNNSEGHLKIWFFDQLGKYDRDIQPNRSKTALLNETNEEFIIRYLPEYYEIRTGRLSAKYANFDWINFISNYYSTLQNDRIKEFLSYDFKVFKPINNFNLNLFEQILDLLNTLDSVHIYTWLGDLQFKDELQSIIQSAKSELQAGDSVACAVKVKAFQDLVDYVYKDSLNADPRFVTIEGWKFLYWNAQYILDRLPSPPVIVNADIEVIHPAMSLVNPGAFTMEIKGTGFTTNSVVYFNGNARITTFVADTLLTAQILATDVSVAGNYPVWVSDGTINSDTLIYKVVSTLPKPVRPVLECVRNNGDGTYTAFFGYKNDNDVSVYIPIGSRNKFTPNPQDRGQTRVFLPGRHYKVFTVNFNGSNLVWTLNGRTSTASSNSAPCQ